MRVEASLALAGLMVAGWSSLANAQESPLRLGQPRNITSSVSLYRPIDQEVGPEGALFIADSGDEQIVKLSFDGQLIWRTGGTGQGPGEFMELYRIGVGQDGAVAAFDLGTQDLSWFEPDGTFRRRVNLETRVHAVGSVVLLPGDLVAMIAYVPRAPEHSIHVFDAAGMLVRSFGPVPSLEDERQRRDWLAGVVHRSGQQLIFTLGIPYEIHRFSLQGDPLQSIRRDYDFPESPGGEVPTRTGDRVVFLGRPKFVPRPLGAMDLGDGWLLGGVLTEPGRATWDVFHDRDLVASYPAPNGWLVYESDPQRGVLYVRSEDAAGETIYLQVPYGVGLAALLGQH